MEDQSGGRERQIETVAILWAACIKAARSREDMNKLTARFLGLLADLEEEDRVKMLSEVFEIAHRSMACLN